MLRYRGYRGEYRFDPATRMAHGCVLLQRGELTFEGASLTELSADMKRAVDSYLARCHQAGIEPSPPQPDLPDAPETSAQMESV